MKKYSKSEAIDRINAIASNLDIKYAIIDDDVIESHANSIGVKLTKHQKDLIKNLAFEFLQSSVEQSIECAFKNIDFA